MTKQKTIIFTDFNITTDKPKEFIKELDKLCNKYESRKGDTCFGYEEEENE
jgi:hypothetical protein